MSIEDSEIEQMTKAPQKGELKLQFQPDTGDARPPPVGVSVDGVQQPGVVGPDPTAKALEGFFKMIDLGLTMVAKFSKGTIEYDGVSNQEIESMGSVAARSEHFVALASMENMPTWMAIGMMAGTYTKHISLHKKQPEKKKIQKRVITPEQQVLLDSVRSNKYKESIARQAEIDQAEEDNPIPTDNTIPVQVIPTQAEEYMDEQEKQAHAALMAASMMTPEQLRENKLLARAHSIKLAQAEKDAIEKARQQGLEVSFD